MLAGGNGRGGGNKRGAGCGGGSSAGALGPRLRAHVRPHAAIPSTSSDSARHGSTSGSGGALGSSIVSASGVTARKTSSLGSVTRSAGI